MADQNSTRFEMRASPGWLGRLDGWRRVQSDLPSRAEAIRRLVDQALRVEPWSDGSAPATKPVGSADLE